MATTTRGAAAPSSGTLTVFDVVFGANVAFVTAQDDTLGPQVVWTSAGDECVTDGILAPDVDADDCIRPAQLGSGSILCGQGGGDGGVWVLLPPTVALENGVTASNPSTAGTITFY